MYISVTDSIFGGGDFLASVFVDLFYTGPDFESKEMNSIYSRICEDIRKGSADGTDLLKKRGQKFSRFCPFFACLQLKFLKPSSLFDSIFNPYNITG